MSYLLFFFIMQDTAAFPTVAAAVSKAPVVKGRLGPPPKKASSPPVVRSYEATSLASPATASATAPALAQPSLLFHLTLPELHDHTC